METKNTSPTFLQFLLCIKYLLLGQMVAGKNSTHLFNSLTKLQVNSITKNGSAGKKNYHDTSFRVKARHVIKKPKWKTMMHMHIFYSKHKTLDEKLTTKVMAIDSISSKFYVLEKSNERFFSAMGILRFMFFEKLPVKQKMHFRWILRAQPVKLFRHQG